MTLRTPLPTPPELPSAEEERRRSAAVVLGVVVAVVVGHVVLAHVPEVAWGLEHLMPTDGREALGAAVLPLVMALATVAGERRLARGVPYPSWLRGLLWGCLATMVLLAPPPGRGDVGEGVRDFVPVFVYCTWGAFALLVLGWFVTVSLRGARQDVDLRRGRPDLGLPPVEPSGWGPLVVRLVVAVAVPVVLLAGVAAFGRHHGDPLYPDLDPVVLSVPGLAGTPLEQRVSTVELKEMTALEPSMVAAALTDGAPMDRMWQVALRTTPGSAVSLTVSALSDDADLDAADARMRAAAEGDAPLPDRWLTPFSQPDAAAVLDGRYLVVLQTGDEGTEVSRTELMRSVVDALTAERRAALVEATDPAAR